MHEIRLRTNTLIIYQLDRIWSDVLGIYNKLAINTNDKIVGKIILSK